jgi:hypothetical protein
MSIDWSSLPDPCPKVPYVNRRDAMTAVRRMRHSQRSGSTPPRPYQCDDCGAWHVTSIRRWEKKL